MSSLKRVVQIMEYVEGRNKEKHEEAIKSKFGEDYRLFSRYCLGNREPYAEFTGTGRQTCHLNQRGVRRLHELQGIIAEEKRATWMKWAAVSIAVFAGIEVLRFVVPIILSWVR